jgi:hypothetical protein
MPLDPLTIGALLGLGKSLIFDAPKEKRQRELAAKTQELSPWTGLKSSPIEEADPFGSALKYGATGYSMGEDSVNQEFKKEMARQMAASMTKTQNPYAQLVKFPERDDNFGLAAGSRLLGGE